MEQDNITGETLRVDEFTRRHLSELARWAVFIGAAGMFMCLLLMTFLVFSGNQLLANMYKTNPALKDTGGAGGLMMVFIAAFLLFPFFMSFYLFRSGRRMSLGISHERQDYLNNSLYNLKRVFRIFGIFLIIYLAFTFLGLLGSLMGAG